MVYIVITVYLMTPSPSLRMYNLVLVVERQSLVVWGHYSQFWISASTLNEIPTDSA